MANNAVFIDRMQQQVEDETSGQITIALIASGLAIFMAFLPIKAYGRFFEWIFPAPYIMLSVVAFIFLIANLWQYRKYKTINYLLSFSICLISGIIAFVQVERREYLDDSPTKFMATTDLFGNEAFLTLDFKENGHLKAICIDHLEDTYSWGSYRSNKDTIELDIPLNFKLGKKAIVTKSTLRFIDDTLTFKVDHPRALKAHTAGEAH